MTCVKEDKSTNTNSPFAFSTQDVNTKVCEQLFSWLSKFAPITKHMNRWRFMFLMYYLLDSHNEDNLTIVTIIFNSATYIIYTG